jgi:RNA polymerase sigma-70 factor (ECF subfamily)
MAQKKSPDRPPVSAPHMEALIERAGAGSSIAFEQLMILFQEDIFRMAYYRTYSHMDAEDLTQEIFTKAFKHISTLKVFNRFRSWLYSIAVNQVRDFNRKKRFRALFGTFSDSDELIQSNTETSDHPEILTGLMREDFWKQVRLLLDKLSRLEREVFLLRFMDHLSIREISQIMEKSESTVKTHLYRALKKFKNDTALIQLLQEESV